MFLGFAAVFVGSGEEGDEVVSELNAGGESDGGKAEEGTFVFLVADYDGHFGVAAFFEGNLGRFGEEGVFWVWAREVGEV